MRHRKIHRLLQILVGGITSAALLNVVSVRQVEAQYLISNSVLGNGCAELVSAQYHITGTVGQPVIGAMMGSGVPSYGTIAGFWYAQQKSLTGIKHGEGIPTEFRLEQNYPNPFNPATTIDYQLPTAGTVTLAVFDVLGRRVVELASGIRQPGYYSLRWDATSLASGIYYARFTVTDEAGRLQFTKVNTLVLMK